MMPTPAAANIEKIHVTRTPGVCGGKPCIAGTRIRVWDVAVHTLGGAAPEGIADLFPQLTLTDVHAALAYFYDNRGEIERQVADDERFVEEMRQKLGPGPLQKLLDDERKPGT